MVRAAGREFGASRELPWDEFTDGDMTAGTAANAEAVLFVVRWTVSWNIREAMRDRGWHHGRGDTPQFDSVSRRTATAMSRTTIANIVYGNTTPDLKSLIALSDVLGMWLLDGVEANVTAFRRRS